MGGRRGSGHWYCLGQQGGRRLSVGLRESVYRVRGPPGLNAVQDLSLRQPLRPDQVPQGIEHSPRGNAFLFLLYRTAQTDLSPPASGKQGHHRLTLHSEVQ
jgi:hypothetical protein